MHKLLMATAALAVAGCVTQEIREAWVRTDGQRIGGNALLAQQLEVDKTVCQGEVGKASLSSNDTCSGLIPCMQAREVYRRDTKQVLKGCMAQRGYLLVSEPAASR